MRHLLIIMVCTANIHLATSIPNLLIAETIETPFHKKLISGSIKVENGFIVPPESPGLGINFDEKVATENPYTGSGLHLEMQEDPCNYQNGNNFLVHLQIQSHYLNNLYF